MRFTPRNASRRLAAFALLLAEIASPRFVFAGQQANEKLVPFLDMPPAKPNMLDWETLDTWVTPQDQVFSISHYGEPKFDPAKFKLEVSGLVEKPPRLRCRSCRRFRRKTD